MSRLMIISVLATTFFTFMGCGSGKRESIVQHNPPSVFPLGSYIGHVFIITKDSEKESQLASKVADLAVTKRRLNMLRIFNIASLPGEYEPIHRKAIQELIDRQHRLESQISVIKKEIQKFQVMFMSFSFVKNEETGKIEVSDLRFKDQEMLSGEKSIVLSTDVPRLSFSFMYENKKYFFQGYVGEKNNLVGPLHVRDNNNHLVGRGWWNAISWK